MLKKNKQIVAFLFMMVILLVKVVAIHSYLHELHHDHHEIVYCQTCDDIQHEWVTPFMLSTSPSFDCEVVLLPVKDHAKIEDLHHIKDLYVSDLTNRPPPVFS